MIIRFDDEWRIATDEHSWMVQRYMGMRKNRQTKEPEPHWESQTWHRSFEQAVASLAERCQRDISAETPADITRELQRLGAAVTRLCEAFENARNAA